MDVNDLHTIEDVSADTYRVVADLIEGSISEEHLVYRECELDEIWRVLQLKAASGTDVSRQMAVVHAVHDLLGENADPSLTKAAADQLRTLAA